MLKINGLLSVLTEIVIVTGMICLSGYAQNLRAEVVGISEVADSNEFLKIVRREAGIDAVRMEMNRPCVQIKLTNPLPEKIGINGISNEKRPGQYEISLLLETEYEKQPQRDRQLKQLDYLAEQGVFDASNATVETTNGDRAVRRYRLTWQGFLLMSRRGGSSSICLAYGKKEFGGINKIEKLQDKRYSNEIYKVTYTLKLSDIPDWAANDRALNLIDGLADIKNEDVRVTEIVKAKEGWSLLKERELYRQVGAFKEMTMPIAIQDIEKVIDAPSLDEINADIHENARSINWLMRGDKNCMPVLIQASDEKKDQDNNDYFVTYYDKKDRRKYEYQNITKSLHFLSALEHAGLAELEYLDKEINGSESMHEAGVRFKVNRQAAEAMGLSHRGYTCIPYGRHELEVVSIERELGVNYTGYHFVAKKIVKEVPDWIRRIAKELPALNSVLENGVVMTGTVIENIYNDEKHWPIISAETFYPRLQYRSLPGFLEPIFINTTEMIPRKEIIAPRITVGDGGSEYEPPQSSKLPVLPSGEVKDGSQRQGKQTQSKFTGKQTVLKSPLYPANEKDVHVISIRSSSRAQGSPRKDIEDIVGKVGVTVRASDGVLVLYAHNPTSWFLNIDDESRIDKIIVVGSQNQKTNITTKARPEIIGIEERALMNSIDVEKYTQFPTGHTKNELLDIATIIRDLTGRDPATYQSQDVAPREGYFINESTSRFRIPLPITPSDYPKNTKIKMRSKWERYWSDREFSLGKLYTEATLKVTDALSAGKSSNIGLCFSRGEDAEFSGDEYANLMIQGEQSVRKNGDVFGVAVDFDNQRMYYQVNGKWITGAPGSGDGIKLEKDKFYRVCARGAVNPGVTDWKFDGNGYKYLENVPSEYIRM